MNKEGTVGGTVFTGGIRGETPWDDRFYINSDIIYFKFKDDFKEYEKRLSKIISEVLQHNKRLKDAEIKYGVKFPEYLFIKEEKQFRDLKEIKKDLTKLMKKCSKFCLL